MGTLLFCIELIYPYLYFIIQLDMPMSKNILENSKNNADIPHLMAITDQGIGCYCFRVLTAYGFQIFQATFYDLLSLQKTAKEI